MHYIACRMDPYGFQESIEKVRNMLDMEKMHRHLTELGGTYMLNHARRCLNDPRYIAYDENRQPKQARERALAYQRGDLK